MRGLKWYKTSEEKPPYDLQVLGWIACESCRKKENHMHNLAYHSWSDCNFYPVTLKDHTWGYPEVKTEHGIYRPSTMIKVMKDTWNHGPTPSYWAYINPPNFEESNEGS